MNDDSEKQRAYLSICLKDTICAETTMCLVQTILHNNKIGWSYGYGQESLIERARNLQAEFFYKTDPSLIGDVILYIDADIVWHWEDAEHIVQKCYEKKSIVGGMYTSRWEHDQFITTRFFPGGQEVRFGEDQDIEVECVSGGFMAIHRDVLEALVDSGIAGYFENGAGSFHRWFGTDIVTAANGRQLFLSEDWYLCHKARELGFHIWANAKPLLGHLGIKKYTPHELPGARSVP